MATRSALAVLGSLVIGCGRVTEPSSGASGADTGRDTPVLDAPAQDAFAFDGTVPDASRIDSFIDSTAEAEYCPSAEYPPRTDGCPCMPQTTGTCTAANAGQVCVYPRSCASDPDPKAPGALRYVCVLHERKEGPPYWDWKGCTAFCSTGKCTSDSDAGADGAKD